MKIIKSFAVLIALMLLSLQVNAAALVFSDLTEDTEYLKSILWLHDRGVIDGYPDGEFKPDKCVNRAEFLKMMFELTGEAMLNQAAPFNDVYATEWYYPYVSNAYQMGIVVGYSDGSFRPDQCMNRVEAIKMATEGMNLEIITADGTYSGFEDIGLDQWYTDYVFTAAINNMVGMLHTENSTMFGTAEGMPRSEVAEMLYRINTIQNNENQKYADWMLPNSPASFVMVAVETMYDDAIMGLETAPITVVEFSDYQCPACRSFHQTTFPLIKEKYIDTNIVNFVYRDFPLTSIHPNALNAALAAECAGDQGGDEVYFDYQDLLFSEDDLSEETLSAYAEDLELDTVEFDECLSSEKFLSEVENDIADGYSLGVMATPSFFINGEKVVGAQAFSVFEEVIDRLYNSIGE